MESTALLFERCTVSMKSSDDHCLQVLRTVISNSLESMACLYTRPSFSIESGLESRLVSTNSSANMSVIQTKIEAIQPLLRSWLSSEKVVGGNMFGYHPVYYQYERNSLLMSHVEVKVIQ